MDIEKKHWEGIEKTTGLTKEEFQRKASIEEEVREFLGDLDEWLSASKRVMSQLNFDPHLFLLWRMSKK